MEQKIINKAKKMLANADTGTNDCKNYNNGFMDGVKYAIKALIQPPVSGSLAYQKAVEYAKFIHGEEYDDPIFASDVEQTIRDFQSGFATAIRIANDR